jgi:hypothetical protein
MPHDQSHCLFPIIKFSIFRILENNSTISPKRNIDTRLADAFPHQVIVFIRSTIQPFSERTYIGCSAYGMTPSRVGLVLSLKVSSGANPQPHYYTVVEPFPYPSS